MADQFLPELPGLRLEHDPIHRHKDVLSHTIAVVENVRPPEDSAEFDYRITRLAALFHDVGKPPTRGYQPGKGITFHHHDVVGARMTRKRMEALRYSDRRYGAPSSSWCSCTFGSTPTRWAGAIRRCAATCATPAICWPS